MTERPTTPSPPRADDAASLDAEDGRDPRDATSTAPGSTPTSEDAASGPGEPAGAEDPTGQVAGTPAPVASPDGPDQDAEPARAAAGPVDDPPADDEALDARTTQADELTEPSATTTPDAARAEPGAVDRADDGTDDGESRDPQVVDPPGGEPPTFAGALPVVPTPRTAPTTDGAVPDESDDATDDSPVGATAPEEPDGVPDVPDEERRAAPGAAPTTAPVGTTADEPGGTPATQDAPGDPAPSTDAPWSPVPGAPRTDEPEAPRHRAGATEVVTTRRRRTGSRAAVGTLAALLVVATAGAVWFYRTSQAWEDRATSYQEAASGLGEELAVVQAELTGAQAELEAVRTQLETAKERIIQLADEKAQATDDREAQRQLADYQERISEAAGRVALALDQCVQGQHQLIGYLQAQVAAAEAGTPQPYDAAELDAFGTDVETLCQAATEANITLQRELQR